MTRNIYILIVTILFGLVYIPSLINTILFSVIRTDNINFSMIPKAQIKSLVFLLIWLMESTLIKRQYAAIFGWILGFILMIAFLMRVMHWPYNTEVIIICTLLMLYNLIYFAIKEKNKIVINYVLIVYIVLRIAVIVFSRNDFFWWLELMIGFGITIIGILHSITNRRELL